MKIHLKESHVKLHEDYSNDIETTTNINGDEIEIIANINDEEVGSIVSYLYTNFDIFYEEQLEGEIDIEKIYDLFNNKKICCISYLYVNNKLRGSGIAKKLMNNLIETCNNENVDVFFLNAYPMDKGRGKLNLNSLVEFYKKFGFFEFLRNKNNVFMIKK